MMSLRIPSRGPLSAHKTPFLQLNTYGLSAFQLLLYHPPPSAPLASLPSFPLPSCFSVKKVGYITLGTRPKRHPRVSSTQTPLSGAFPHMYYLNIIRRPEKLGFSHSQREWKKTEQRKRQGESDSFLETWSQDFGAACSVYMTSCAVFSLSAFAGRRATETCAKKRKIKWKVSPSPGLETIKTGWCHSLIQQHTKWDVVARERFVNTEDFVSEEKRNTFSLWILRNKEFLCIRRIWQQMYK